ncbi:hypothetical protein SAMN05421788_1011380 [Filimonas lacunae]|uniref:Uncharacterized protein n=1 Tax=Filimonas lacunae TaxID=477680 RepID=A0A173MRI0_9BACT|nr:hypothetical protein [Filimonas lacunae]BAV09948.1 hypothetical protein FLA_6001 [Filimonas lacunae]SIS81524.1 hypothetical protein SAMN05421788_1011380 [Filimonas lacunae]
MKVRKILIVALAAVAVNLVLLILAYQKAVIGVLEYTAPIAELVLGVVLLVINRKSEAGIGLLLGVGVSFLIGGSIIIALFHA